MQSYPTYKPSGIDWVGDIPEHWEMLPLKYCVQDKITDGPHETPKFLNYGIPFVSAEAIENGEINWNKIRGYISQEDDERYSIKCKPRQGDVFIVKSGSTTGKIGYVKSDRDFNIWSPLALVRTKSGIISRFIYHFLSSLPFQTQVQLFWSFGTQPNIGMNVLENLKLTLPSDSEEQTTIAHFLDQKTAEIDHLIAQKQALIQKLEEEKQAIINQAVTKGLNPDASMKDSGLPWVGEIPEHWEVTRLKFLCDFILDGTHGSFKRQSTGYRLLSVRNIIDDEFVFRDDDSRVSQSDFDSISSRFLVQEGDIQLAIVGATLGKVAVVRKMDELFVTQRSVATLRPLSERCLSEYLFYSLKSDFYQEYLWMNTGFSAQPGVYLSTLQNSMICIPGMDEQLEIVAHLNSKRKEFSKAIEIVNREIALIQEYKTALISEAVTGKIDVRNFDKI